jgi:hypothetical protein
MKMNGPDTAPPLATALPDLLGVCCGTLAQARIEHASRGFRLTTATVALFQANAITELLGGKRPVISSNPGTPLFQMSSVFTLV